MGEIRRPNVVCLVAGICFNDSKQNKTCLDRMQEKFGAIESELAPILFVHTNYYAEEMGHALKKMYISFAKLIDPAELPAIKHFTNALEEELSIDGKRDVNIDPGYIETPKLILATTKNFSHRIYIGKGIYGDVQLYWKNGHFNANPWTYPDYKDETVLRYFEKVRNAYFNKLKELDSWK